MTTLTVTAGDISASFPLADFSRLRLLEGLDDIDLTLRKEPEISAFEHGRPSFLPAVV